MSAGSGASNLGYGNTNPYNMSPFVNGTSSSYAGSFSSNEIAGTPPGPLPGLAGAKINTDAAAGIVPGICMSGGAKRLKNKIKNITKRYKMKGGKKSRRVLRKKLRSRAIGRSMALAGGSAMALSGSRSMALAGGSAMALSGSRSMALAGGRRRTRHMRSKRRLSRMRGGSAPYPGGYGQYQNNLPMTNTYQVAGINLPANQSALANPPPATALSNCTNCVDNYNNFTNSGFPSRGN
jgi:hypothetical protein